MTKLRLWHTKRVAAASEAVGGDLSNLWQNDVAKDVTTSYTHLRWQYRWHEIMLVEFCGTESHPITAAAVLL